MKKWFKANHNLVVLMLCYKSYPPPAVNISQSIFKPINKAHLHFAREIAGCTVHLKCNEPWENSGFYRFSIIEELRFEKKVCSPIQFLFCVPAELISNFLV